MTTHFRGPVFSEEGFVVGQGIGQPGTHFSGPVSSRGGFGGPGLGQPGTHYRGPVFSENGFEDGPLLLGGEVSTDQSDLVISVPTGLSVPVGSKIVLAVGLQLGIPDVISVTDDGANSYNLIFNEARGLAYYADVTTPLSAGDEITFSFTASNFAHAIAVVLTGNATGAPVALDFAQSVPVGPITVPNDSIAIAILQTTSETSFKRAKGFSILAEAETTATGPRRTRLSVRPLSGATTYNPQVSAQNISAGVFTWARA